MKQVDIDVANTILSALVEEPAAGEDIIITKNGSPLARLIALPDAPRKPPNFGFWSHLGWSPPEDFDAPDPEIEALFYRDGTV